ncbi:hypothetical protein A2368_04645 [Candidatus Collierbacteria bacterium RIFOXYB1_FULL_49_13]|uniref:Ribonuclease VapC n=1 Tax=Candidatus Collierbacteria bacterium RIFOXYB1_FULL_49_13 TaxID=1817728 RepID=A0A1F5FJK9_9BACT|nr:MAG: hypothetical protein A2368_04645 [Candidatus Collierbacteria bacterium RIFOXYB1_FULL_49_13]
MVVLDTCVIIDHLRRREGESALVSVFKKHREQRWAVSVVTIQELYEGRSTRSEAGESSLLATLSLFEVLAYNTEVASLAGKIARDREELMDFADAAIAATAVVNEAGLYTLNRKHFQMVPSLELVEL